MNTSFKKKWGKLPPQKKTKGKRAMFFVKTKQKQIDINKKNEKKNTKNFHFFLKFFQNEK